MNLRTKNDLKDSLDKDFGWRKQELTQILTNVDLAQGKNINISLRTAVLLLYAHWEGFIKHAASSYLNYVKNQSLKYKNLVSCFRAIALKQQLNIFTQTNKATIHNQFLEYIENCTEEIASISDTNVISTASNLKSTILKEILTAIGLDFSPFELKANLIDEQLLNYRNTIAHGEYLRIDSKEYKILHSEVFNMMVTIKNDIENAVALDKFKKD